MTNQIFIRKNLENKSEFWSSILWYLMFVLVQYCWFTFSTPPSVMQNDTECHIMSWIFDTRGK